MFNVRIDIRPPDVAARELLCARSSGMRLVEHLKYFTSQRGRHDDTEPPQKNSVLHSQLVAVHEIRSNLVAHWLWRPPGLHEVQNARQHHVATSSLPNANDTDHAARTGFDCL